jgi:hypothetical protein
MRESGRRHLLLPASQLGLSLTAWTPSPCPILSLPTTASSPGSLGRPKTAWRQGNCLSHGHLERGARCSKYMRWIPRWVWGVCDGRRLARSFASWRATLKPWVTSCVIPCPALTPTRGAGNNSSDANCKGIDDSLPGLVSPGHIAIRIGLPDTAPSGSCSHCPERIVDALTGSPEHQNLGRSHPSWPVQMPLADPITGPNGCGSMV